MDKARKIDGELYCGDIFRTFVKRGEVVKAGYSKSIEFSPVRANQDAADVEVIIDLSIKVIPEIFHGCWVWQSVLFLWKDDCNGKSFVHGKTN